MTKYKCKNTDCKASKFNIIYDESWTQTDYANGSPGNKCTMCDEPLQVLELVKTESVMPAVHFKGTGWPTSDFKRQNQHQKR